MDKYVFWLLLVSIIVVGFLIFAWIITKNYDVKTLDNKNKKTNKDNKFIDSNGR